MKGLIPVHTIFVCSRMSQADNGAVISLSLNLQCLTANRVATCVPICSCGLPSNIPLYGYTAQPNLFIPLPLDGHLGCFQGLVVPNKAVGNFHIKVFVWRHSAISLTQIPECVSVGSVYV